MINFNLESEKLQNEFYGAIASVKQIENDKQTEIEIATNEINKKYASKIKEADSKVAETKNNLQKYQDDIIMYSKFNHELIGNALTYLIKIFDNLDFIYEYGKHIVLYKCFFKIDKTDKTVIERYDTVKMLIKKEMKNPEKVYKDPELGENIIEAYVAKKEAIVLDELIWTRSADRPTTTFYKMDNNQLIFSVNFNGFTYLEDFINYVIEYRYNNNLKEFSNDDMKSLIVSFVNMHRDEINARHFERLNNQVKSLTL